ncbi:hypothetical protein [Parachitinimonas caeni]|uniref:SnoaL-like domain-containing protein n=1 Tax=Parachitinimonas caeni TaxID=3031301 RepID=A0ABT7DRP8_9NEIS|nr:hypothetical protein [Parachitinimonas caeni]MDK2122747.1 hypothetical protein [Parachitinimonas caeni]
MKTLLLAACLLPVSATVWAKPCPQTGNEAPLALHKSWILQGWERKPGDPPFVFAQKMRRYYDLASPQGVFYDNFAPGQTQLFHNAGLYGANWEALQNNARSIAHALTGGHDQIAGSKVASTTLGFVGKLHRQDDEIIAFDGRSQLGWVCQKGHWKIRHEMNYAWLVKPEAIASYLN